MAREVGDDEEVESCFKDAEGDEKELFAKNEESCVEGEEGNCGDCTEREVVAQQALFLRYVIGFEFLAIEVGFVPQSEHKI